MHQNLVALVVLAGDRVLLGKHSCGKFEGLYGVASTHAHLERRPQKTAARLAELTTLGVLGNRNDLEVQCKSMGKTATQLQVYVLKTEVDILDTTIKSVQNYVSSCFPVDAFGKPTYPLGLIPWSNVKWVSLEDAMKMKLDDVALQAVRFVSCSEFTII